MCGAELLIRTSLLYILTKTEHMDSAFAEMFRHEFRKRRKVSQV